MTGPQLIAALVGAPTEAHPLTWPASVKRHPSPQRSRFSNPSIHGSLNEIRNELRKLGAVNVIISSNLPLRRDGEPIAGRGLSLDHDQGAAVYWSLAKGKDKVPYCLPCDKWRTLAENLHAIALTIAALRAVERHGAVHVVQAFEGFKALPPGSEGSTAIAMAPPWREVLGADWPDLPNDELLGVARARWKALMKMVHPNSSAAPEDPDVAVRIAELNAARDAAEAELQA